jgi:hypothetical protein
LPFSSGKKINERKQIQEKTKSLQLQEKYQIFRKIEKSSTVNLKEFQIRRISGEKNGIP